MRTKLPVKLADKVTDAVLTIKKDTGIDLHMVEIMNQKEKMSNDSRLVKGLVLRPREDILQCQKG